MAYRMRGSQSATVGELESSQKWAKKEYIGKTMNETSAERQLLESGLMLDQTGKQVNGQTPEEAVSTGEDQAKTESQSLTYTPAVR